MSNTPNQHLSFIELKNATRNRPIRKQPNGKVEQSPVYRGLKTMGGMEYTPELDLFSLNSGFLGT